MVLHVGSPKTFSGLYTSLSCSWDVHIQCLQHKNKCVWLGCTTGDIVGFMADVAFYVKERFRQMVSWYVLEVNGNSSYLTEGWTDFLFSWHRSACTFSIHWYCYSTRQCLDKCFWIWKSRLSAWVHFDSSTLPWTQQWLPIMWLAQSVASFENA